MSPCTVNSVDFLPVDLVNFLPIISQIFYVGGGFSRPTLHWRIFNKLNNCFFNNNFLRCRILRQLEAVMIIHHLYAIQGRDTSVRAALSKGCIVKGKQIPRDTSFKGCTVWSQKKLTGMVHTVTHHNNILFGKFLKRLSQNSCMGVFWRPFQYLAWHLWLNYGVSY